MKTTTELLEMLKEVTEALSEARRFIALNDDNGFAAYNETALVQGRARDVIREAGASK